MKSQAGLANRLAVCAPAGAVRLAAMGLAAAVLIAAPARSDAHPGHGGGHAQGHAAQAHAAVWHGGEAHAVRAEFHGGGGFHGGAGFHGGGVHGPVGYVGWRGGDARWVHGWHGGAYGWWYINAGIWTAYPYYPYYGYPYGYPYYGYPAPYAVAPPETTAYNGNLPPQQQTWFWCDAARGYYPAVQSCPGGWRPVTPDAAPKPSAPPPAPPLTASPQ